MTNIKSIQRQCLEEKLSVLEAISQIDSEIGGIRSVDFKNRTKFKIHNHNEIYSLDVIGIKNRQLDRLYGMAVLGYVQAQKNGGIYSGEIHISREASTKHHLGGIYSILNRYQQTGK